MPVFEVEVSIVMPCLNEAEALPFCISNAFRFIEKNGIIGEVIIADNGSTDNSTNIAQRMNVKVVVEPELGYGNAIMSGIKVASGRYIIVGDADGSYDFGALLPFVEKLRSGNDLVIGNRFKGGIKKGAMPFLHRHLGNPVLSLVGRAFFKIPIGDFHCGLRGITKEAYLSLDLKTTGMEFASEMIVKAALHKKTITETPVVLYPDQRSGRSHLNTWRDGWRHLLFLLLYSPRWLFLIPGMVLMFLGLTGTIVLIFGPVRIGQKKLDIHTLVYTTGFLLVGFQFVSFYIFSRLYAAKHGLWPDNGRFAARFEAHFSLEKGLVGGAILFFSGLFLSLKSFLYWQHTHFGNLDPVIVLRWVIPSMLLCVLGLQIIVSFFYLSFFTINSRS